jgi:hypothetical protein
MPFYKRFLLGLTSTLFKTLLFTTALIAAIVIVFGNPTQLKASLNESKIYDTFVDSILKASQKQSNEQGNDLPLDRPEIRQAAAQAFSPELLRSSTEQIIDGGFSWLNGTTSAPTFRIDLSSAKQQFVQALGDYAADRVQSLPPCTLSQLRELANTDIDPFNVSCAPPTVTPIRAREEVVQDLSSNQDFLGNSVLTADSLPRNENGKTVFDEAKQVPQIFQWAKRAGWILGSLTVIIGLSLIFLRHDKRRGVRMVGVSLLGTGIFLLLSTLLINYLFSQANKPGGQLTHLTNNDFQTTLIAFINSINRALNRTILRFAISYAVLGAVALGALWYTGRKRTKPQPISEPAITDRPEPIKEEKETSSTEQITEAKDEKL